MPPLDEIFKILLSNSGFAGAMLVIALIAMRQLWVSSSAMTNRFIKHLEDVEKQRETSFNKEIETRQSITTSIQATSSILSQLVQDVREHDQRSTIMISGLHQYLRPTGGGNLEEEIHDDINSD